MQLLNRVSSKSVALHTAGIVPSIHTSDSYGRVQFYDFAGDHEYYSSHAAILEKLFLSDIGNNICIIVLNLQDEDEKKYGKVHLPEHHEFAISHSHRKPCRSAAQSRVAEEGRSYPEFITQPN